ncbi:DUF4097 family beta strand repeat-containing protein [Thermococcus sp. 9N3]|uniref:DUF4097 family beta strand repeat-containing protein n=1 Tax=Thermococcus sp. 9N3 TaxID=163002 RepID=UPI00143081F6|nr:DUF4097 family beta strand repeat-containing protein [Thermococcus sp. 9N3]NJE48647.1 hypothetical protein [Thermococcus sp. 9N3]
MMFENVREVDLKATNGRVEIEGWENDYVEVNYTTHGEVEVIIENENGKLVIREEPKRRFRFAGVLKAEEGWAEIELKVPKGVPVKAKNVNGEIIAEGVRFTGVTTVNGEITLRNCEAELIKSVNGEIEAHLPVAGPLEVSTVNGDIEVTLEELDGDVSVSCVNGDITLRLTEFCDARVEARKVNGDVKLIGIQDGVIGTGDFIIRVKTVNGDVRVELI